MRRNPELSRPQREATLIPDWREHSEAAEMMMKRLSPEHRKT
jgi:hypothetical protein